jgi:hypothetical protein
LEDLFGSSWHSLRLFSVFLVGVGDGGFRDGECLRVNHGVGWGYNFPCQDGVSRFQGCWVDEMYWGSGDVDQAR